MEEFFYKWSSNAPRQGCPHTGRSTPGKLQRLGREQVYFLDELGRICQGMQLGIGIVGVDALGLAQHSHHHFRAPEVYV